MWQISEYMAMPIGEWADGAPVVEHRRVAVVQSDMTQNEAISRAQRMNDAIDFEGAADEVWYVAEHMRTPGN